MKMNDLTENGGRIVKGVNTTVDVGTDEISKQAKKFGNSVDKDGFPPTMSTVVKPKKTTVKEGYRLRLERDKSANMLVLHIKDTRTGRRSEVRGKLGYETDGYDPDDKLHQLLDKVGRSASVSDMMNGDVVTINPTHPQGPSATKAASAVTAETILEKLGEIAPNTEIYVDMDGVLADFFGEWAKAMGKKSFRDIEDPEAAIGKIKDIEDFWLNLPVLPQAKQLLTLIKKVKGKYKICTSPLADDPRSEPHKREWVKKNLAFFLPEEVIVTHNKPKWATQKDGTPNILIDDYGVNIDKWEAAGGIGFKYKDHKFDRTAKAIKQKMTTENFADGKKKVIGKYLYHVTYASGLLGMLKDGHLNTNGPSGFADYFSMTADPKYVVSGNPEVQIVIDAGRVSQLETFEQHKEDWDDSGKDNGDWESEYRVEETIPWNYVVAVKILKAKATPEIIELAKKRGVKLVGKDTSVTENFADGKKKGKSRPGRVKKSGASCSGSVTSLRKKAKAGGEKGRMYHWCANMKSGRKKK
jgi:5'(3')-deoxyribonucleotidase